MTKLKQRATVMARRAEKAVATIWLAVVLLLVVALCTTLGHLLGIGIVSLIHLLPAPLGAIVETLLVLLPFVVLARFLLK